MNEREKELKALTQCADALGNLEHESIMKVFQMLSIHFGILPIISNVNPSFNNSGLVKKETSNIIPKQIEDRSLNVTSSNVQITIDYPSLKDLVIKNYPKNEAEWILCYGFYASNFGSDFFTIEDVKRNYKESKRFTPNNSKNFSTNFSKCINNDWFKHTNGEEYVMKDEGTAYASEVLHGNSISKERKRTKRPKI